MQTRATIVNGLGTLTQLMQARDGNRAVDFTLQLWDLALHNLGPDHDTTERFRETLDRVGEFVRLTGSRELALRLFEEMAKICSKYDDSKGQAHALDKQAMLR